MDNIKSTPRVDFSNFQSYQGQNVKLVGKVVRCDQSHAVIKTCDEGEIQVNLLSDSKCLEAGQDGTVEVTGRVEEDGSVSELVSDVMSGPYNPELYANTLRIMKEYSLLSCHPWRVEMK